MFWLPFQIILILLSIYIIYRYWFQLHIRRTLSWLPSTPLVPFLGSVLELGKDPTEILGNVQRLSNNSAKSVYFEIGPMQYGFITKNHELMEFLLSSNKAEILNKSSEYNIFGPWLGTGLLTATGTKWKKRRRIITPAFHFSILEQFIEEFDTHGNILIKKLKEEAIGKDKVDIYPYVTNCTLDIISASAMGVSIKSQEGGNNDYVTSVQGICRILMMRIVSALFRDEYLFRLHPEYKNSQHYLKVMHDFTNSVIQDRIEKLKNKNGQIAERNFEGKKRLAFLDLLLNCTIDDKPLSKEDIREEVDTFMFEGHDTTSIAVSMTLYLLANHQDIQTLARNEQREIFNQNKDRPTTIQDLNEMKYLDLVIKESLRLYPPVPLIARSVTEDIQYQGNIIPKGIVAALFIYGINRDPDYHEKAEEFIPDRHLTLNGKYFSNIPFSAGPRNCIGQKFAILEMKSVISKILRNFELLPTEPVHEPVLVMALVFKPTNGICIRLKNHDWK